MNNGRRTLMQNTRRPLLFREEQTEMEKKGKEEDLYSFGRGSLVLGSSPYILGVCLYSEQWYESTNINSSSCVTFSDTVVGARPLSHTGTRTNKRRSREEELDFRAGVHFGSSPRWMYMPYAMYNIQYNITCLQLRVFNELLWHSDRDPSLLQRQVGERGRIFFIFFEIWSK